MPPKPTNQENRVLCPYCSGEYAYKYIWLHKRQFCPMRPGRQEEIKAEATGLHIVPKSDMLYGGSATKGVVAPATPFPTVDDKFSNIISIDLTEEYNNMVKVMKKKKEEEEEDNQYQCGKCKTVFEVDKQPTNCPDCGVAFA